MDKKISQNFYQSQISPVNYLEGKKGQNTPNIIITPTKESGDRYPIVISLRGIPEGVKSVIDDLYVCRFAQVYDWSPAIKAPKPGEIIKVTTKYFVT